MRPYDFGLTFEFIAKFDQSVIVGHWHNSRLPRMIDNPQELVQMLEVVPVEFNGIIGQSNAQFILKQPVETKSFVEIDMALNLTFDDHIRRYVLDDLIPPILAPTIHDIELNASDIPAALEMIHKAQQPEQARIRKAISQEQARRDLNKQVIPHARIVSIAA